MGPQGSLAKAQGYSVLVVELSDDFGPRRRPDRPNLYVGVVLGDPHIRFDAIRASKRRRAAVRNFGVRVRDDLTPPLISESEESARETASRLIKKLKRRGYAVNGYTTVWHVYVIELKDTVGPRRDPRFPWVYVGETSIGVEERYRQHVEGARNRRGRLFSPVVMKHHLRLRPDLYEAAPVLFSAHDAKKAERDLAERLASIGYSVKGGH